MQNKKLSHFIALFHHFFTFTLYPNTSHALFGILYHELTSQNQGNDVQACWQSNRSARLFFSMPGLRLSCLLGKIVTPDSRLFQIYSTPSELNDDMSVLVAVIHFRVGWLSTPLLVKGMTTCLCLSPSFTSEWDFDIRSQPFCRE